ncbi:hypothetical protein SYNPS1DRAFT_23685, partial [Syncephalis pseudoplumigaleata]
MPRDVLGVWLHLDEVSPQYRFYLNGVEQPHTTLALECEKQAEQWLRSVARLARTGHYQMFPAASFTAGQQAQFNFGATPFRFPPSGDYNTLARLIVQRPELMVAAPTEFVYNTPCWTRPDDARTTAIATASTTIRGDATGFDTVERHSSSCASDDDIGSDRASSSLTLCELCCNAYANASFLP